MRREVHLSLRPIPERFAAVYRRRGMAVPELSSDKSPAALWPTHPRRLHEWFALANGYFWMPCVLCGRCFGGHEIVDTIPDPIAGAGRGISICPFCTAERNGATA